MSQSTTNNPPRRVTDLIDLHRQGAVVTCRIDFEILPVDFRHRDSHFQAYIFLCRFKGSVDGSHYFFRKCYARGCPHNLCPHVSQAVMIANRYLQRDYHRLNQGGIAIEQKLFTLKDMVVKYEDLHETPHQLLTIHDYINIAREGNAVSVTIDLEYVDAVEHFANEKNAQTFLNGGFDVNTLGRSGNYQRCLGCYQTQFEHLEKKHAVKVANARLELLYEEFDQVGIDYEKRFFE
jgi:hypothetical protein